MTTPVIETVTFTLLPGADATVFAQAAQDMNAWITAQPGFIQRRLSCTEEGLWIEHIEWADMASAKAAAAAIGSDPAHGPFLSAIDGASAKMHHSALTVTVN